MCKVDEGLGMWMKQGELIDVDEGMDVGVSVSGRRETP
jgi:hypothetical protein